MAEIDDFDFVVDKDAKSLFPEKNHIMFKADPCESDYERKARMLTQLQRTCAACTMCELGRKAATKDQHLFCDPHVFSNQNPTRFCVFGQNPGWNEVRKCTPFIGQSGNNFDKALFENGLSREEFYIGNCVKCFTDGNQKPTFKHIERCRPFLQMEINLIRPLIVGTLGAVAFECLCPDEVRDGLKYSDALGKITRSRAFDVPVFAIYHPSPLNLNTPANATQFRRQMLLFCGLVKKLKERHGI